MSTSKPRQGKRPVLKSGDPAPDFSVLAVDGQAVSLSGVLSEGCNVLLVFLRHLG